MALLYAVQVFYSFFIMLVFPHSASEIASVLTHSRLLFMTYNGWIMLAVAVGAFVGYLVFGGGSSAAKSAACH